MCLFSHPQRTFRLFPPAVAVAQLVNKLGSGIDPGFTKEDEEIMEYFAMFAGLPPSAVLPFSCVCVQNESHC